MLKNIGIFGTSGFSRETLDVCIDMGYEEIIFIGDGRQNKEYWVHRVVDEDQLTSLKQRGSVNCQSFF